MADQIDLAFRLTANASGMNAGIAQAERSLQKVGQTARVTSRDFRDAARVTEAVKTPTEKYAQAVNRLDSLMAKGLLTQEVYARAVTKADDELRAAEGSLGAYEAAATKVESAVNRMSAAVEGVGRAGQAVAEMGEKFMSLAGAAIKAGGVLAVFRAATMKRYGNDSIVSLAFGFSKAIAVIKGAEYAMKAFGVEADAAAKFATQATVAFTAFKAAGMAGFTTAGVKAYAQELDKTHGISTVVSSGLTRLGVSAATQSKWFASMAGTAEAAGAAIGGAATMSALAFAQWAAAGYVVAKAMFATQSAIEGAAAATKALDEQAAAAGMTLQNLHVAKLLDAGVARQDIVRLGHAINELDVQHFGELARAVEASEKAASRSNAVFSNIGKSLGSPLVGMFTAIREGSNSITDGFTDVGIGLLSLLQPIGQALRPVGTLIGTAAEGAMKFAGVLLSGVGVALRYAGALTTLALAMPTKGLNAIADAIRGAVGGAFDWVSRKIESVNKLLDDFYNAMSQVPVIGGMFAGSVQTDTGPAVGAAPAGAVMAAAAASAPAAADEVDDFTAAISRQEAALSSAIDTAMKYGTAGADAVVQYQEQLRSLQDDLERGILNETSYADAAGKVREAFEGQIEALKARGDAARKLADEDAAREQDNLRATTRATDAFYAATEAASAFGEQGAAAAAAYEGGLTSLNAKLEDGRINTETYAREADGLRSKFQGEMNGIKAVADAQRKRDEDVRRMEERIGEAGGFRDGAAAALSQRSNEALQVSDVRSSEGIAQFMALASGREDPAVAEYRKSHETLKAMLAELRALQAAPLEFAGAAGG